MQGTGGIALEFGVKTQAYRSGDPDAALADSDFKGMRERVLKRDQWRCRACGCPSAPQPGAPSAGLEVHHLDNNHANNEISNLAALCPLCHGIFHIGFAARTRPGAFVWLPEISQAGLNLFVHLCAVSRNWADQIFPKGLVVPDSGKTPEMRAAEQVEARLDDAYAEMRRHPIPEGLLEDPETGRDLGGVLASDPTAFGSMLAAFLRRHPDGKGLARLRSRLSGLRYLYSVSADREAPVYAQCPAWITGQDQAQRRLAEAARLLGQQAADAGEGD